MRPNQTLCFDEVRLGFKPVENFEHFAEHRQEAIDAA